MIDPSLWRSHTSRTLNGDNPRTNVNFHYRKKDTGQLLVAIERIFQSNHLPKMPIGLFPFIGLRPTRRNMKLSIYLCSLKFLREFFSFFLFSSDALSDSFCHNSPCALTYPGRERNQGIGRQEMWCLLTILGDWQRLLGVNVPHLASLSGVKL